MANLAIEPNTQRKLRDMARKAETIEILNAEGLEVAGDLIKKISGLQKAIEEQRTLITKPLNESIKNANAFFKKFSEPLKEADKIVRQKMVDFQKTLPEEVEQNTFGEAHFVSRKTFRVLDITKVPAEFLLVNEVAVNKAIKEGATKIKGLELFTEKKVSL